MSFQRLVRFVNEHGTTLYGDLKSEPTADLTGAEVEVLEGDVEKGFQSTGRTDKIHKLLCPLPSVPIVICIGLNYQKHANEANVWLRLVSFFLYCQFEAYVVHSSKSPRTRSSSLSRPMPWLARTTISPSTLTPKACWTTKGR